MDEVWESFIKSSRVNAYVAGKENAIVLCSSGTCASDALAAMGALLDNYNEPVPIASSFYLEDETYYATIIISGYKGD